MCTSDQEEIHTAHAGNSVGRRKQRAERFLCLVGGKLPFQQVERSPTPLKEGWTLNPNLTRLIHTYIWGTARNANCLFWWSVPMEAFPKTSLTELLLVNSLQCRTRVGKNKKLLSNSGGLFQSHTSKATVTFPLTWKENKIGMVTNLFTLNHVLFSSQVVYSLLGDQNCSSIHVSKNNPLFKWSSGNTKKLMTLTKTLQRKSIKKGVKFTFQNLEWGGFFWEGRGGKVVFVVFFF